MKWFFSCLSALKILPLMHFYHKICSDGIRIICVSRIRVRKLLICCVSSALSCVAWCWGELNVYDVILIFNLKFILRKIIDSYFFFISISVFVLFLSSDGRYYETVKANFERADRVTVVRTTTCCRVSPYHLLRNYNELIFNWSRVGAQIVFSSLSSQHIFL